METLKKFKQFVDEINLENGRNYKISVLEKFKADEDIKYYLNYIFNPYIVTGISDKKLHKQLSYSQNDYESKNITSVKDLLEYIKLNNTGTDAVLKTVNAFIDINPNFPVELCELIDKIITKNVILGIDTKTINKVIPKLIPTFNVQLANKYFDKPDVVEGKTFAITTKIDGMRCIMLKENGKVTFWSRQGKQIEGLVDLIEEAKSFPDNICLDGELIAKETSKEDTYKNTMKTAGTKETEKHNLKMMVFDYMPINDFKTQTGSLKYNERRKELYKIWGKCAAKQVYQCPGGLYMFELENGFINDKVDILKNTFEYFELLQILYCGTETSQIEKILKEQVANGEEGVMLNMCDAYYEFGRSNVLLKCKLFQDTEVEITGFEAGDNKLSNTLGNLICNYKGYELKVGSGFKDEERDYIWNHQEEYIGKLAVVKYFEETSNANGGLSLRFPVYKGVRLKEDL